MSEYFVLEYSVSEATHGGDNRSRSITVSRSVCQLSAIITAGPTLDSSAFDTRSDTSVQYYFVLVENTHARLIKPSANNLKINNLISRFITFCYFIHTSTCYFPNRCVRMFHDALSK